MTASRPRKFSGERAKDVVERFGDDDVVIDGHQPVQYDVSDTDTYSIDNSLFTPMAATDNELKFH